MKSASENANETLRPLESDGDAEPEIAHVLIIDVVGYSTLLINEQSQIIGDLTQIVKATVEFQRADTNATLVSIATGDGMALVFFHEPQAPIKCAIEIARALKQRTGPDLRMGIHSGPVNRVVDVSGKLNVAGAGIDIAQRVMDCGDGGHILLSKRAAEDLLPMSRWSPHLHEIGECEVKHGRKVSLVNFYTGEIGNPMTPTRCLASKHDVRSISRRWQSPVGLAVGILILSALVFSLGRFHRTSHPSPISSKSIAVLPFQNLNNDPERAYFADGVQEEILTRLSRIRDLKVISRTSTQRYKTAPDNLREIAAQLGVAYVLEGSAQHVADQVRVNVQLVNATTDAHVWADTFDRRLTDIFAVESEIAARIANELRTKLSATDQERLASQPTNDSDAHELYLRARYFFRKQTGPDLEKAIDYFNQAIARDPKYALAYAGLSDCYRVLFFWSANPTRAEREEDLKKARVAAEKALSLDPTLGEAHESLASILFLTEFNLGAAEREFQRAIDLDPNDSTAHQWYANTVLVATNKIDLAIDELRRAVELDPFSPFINANLGYHLILARRYPEAIAQCRKAIELDPTYYLSHQDLAQALELSGRPDDAIAEYETPHPASHEPYSLAFRAHIYAVKGDRTTAMQLLAQMQELANDRDVWRFGFALAELGLGRKQEAMDWLERSYQNKEYEMIVLLRLHPMLDPLRGEPRFHQFVDQVLPQQR
jgi:TolB-like protein/Flp pilus assembly protein TadD/class 3 adenylate cyclase